MKAFVDTQIKERGYGTSSEYIRELIRSDQTRQAETSPASRPDSLFFAAPGRFTYT